MKAPKLTRAEWQRRTGGRDGAQSRAEDGEWQHQELDLWQQESETGGEVKSSLALAGTSNF